jgi:uroporphyrinogen-III synthase
MTKNNNSQKEILIFRERKDSLELMKHFVEKNFSVFFEPLTKIKIKNFAEIKDQIDESFFTSDNSALIITSIRAAEFVVAIQEEVKINHKIKIFCLSEKTADFLTKNGFKNIEISKEKNAKSIKEKITDFAKENYQIIKNINFIYFSADQVRFDFAEKLSENKNIKIKRIVCYQVELVENFSNDFLNLYQRKISAKKNFDYILIYSIRVAEIFIEMVRKNNMVNFFSSSEISCVSGEIAKIFEKSEFKNISIFPNNF